MSSSSTVGVVQLFPECISRYTTRYRSERPHTLSFVALFVPAIVLPRLLCVVSRDRIFLLVTSCTDLDHVCPSVEGDRTCRRSCKTNTTAHALLLFSLFSTLLQFGSSLAQFCRSDFSGIEVFSDHPPNRPQLPHPQNA